MMGFAAAHRPVVRAVLDEDVVRVPDGKVHIDRAVAVWGGDGRVHVRRARAQGSHQLAATATANCLVRIPDGTGLPAGAEADVTFLGPDAGPISSGVASAGRGRLSP
jgi:molybdopterin biosynthesis enzyme